MKEVVLGLLGLGNIGGGVWDLIREFGGEVRPDPGIRRGSQQAYGREARGEEGSRAGQENPQGQGSTG